MKNHFHVRPLTTDRIDAAFPLVQAANPRLTLDQWRRFATSPDVPGGRRGDAGTAGILVAENARGYLQGYCTYRIQSDICRGSILAVSDFVTFGLANGEAAASALLEALEALARRLGCAAVRLHVEGATELHDGGVELQAFLKRVGHDRNAVRVLRPVDLVLD